MLKVITPATSANLGPGFDSFGIAYELYNTFEVELSEQLFIEGCEEKYRNENNLFYVAFHEIAKIAQRSEKCRVRINAQIPVSRGLGSSSSLICAGVLAADALFESGLNKEELFVIAARIEGHPDNVAPCLFGGFTCSYQSDGPKHIGLKVKEDLRFTLIVPDYEVATAMARSVLPEEVPMEDAVYNLSHSALLIEAMRTGRDDLLKEALNDRLHQPYRRKLISDFDRIEKLVKEKGALGFVISGSGSTMLAISKDPEFSKKIKDELSDYQILDLKVDTQGARIL